MKLAELLYNDSVPRENVTQAMMADRYMELSALPQSSDKQEFLSVNLAYYEATGEHRPSSEPLPTPQYRYTDPISVIAVEPKITSVLTTAQRELLQTLRNKLTAIIAYARPNGPTNLAVCSAREARQLIDEALNS